MLAIHFSCRLGMVQCPATERSSKMPGNLVVLVVEKSGCKAKNLQDRLTMK